MAKRRGSARFDLLDWLIDLYGEGNVPDELIDEIAEAEGAGVRPGGEYKDPASRFARGTRVKKAQRQARRSRAKDFVAKGRSGLGKSKAGKVAGFFAKRPMIGAVAGPAFAALAAYDAYRMLYRDPSRGAFGMSPEDRGGRLEISELTGPDIGSILGELSMERRTGVTDALAELVAGREGVLGEASVTEASDFQRQLMESGYL